MIAVGSHRIGPGQPMYVIAEMSANHLGDLGRARAIVAAAAEAGADAVKLQTYTPDTMTLDVDDDRFRVGEGSLWQSRHLFELYAEAMTPWEWHEELMAQCHALGMDCFSSPFDVTAVEFLERLDVPAWKVASFEIVDLPLISRVASTGKPVIISTGMATRTEIDEAVTAARAAGCRDLVLLRCNSAYPAPAAEMDLLTIPDMRERWGLEVGLSDHTLGIVAAVTARVLGATVLEKHLTLRRADGGPDGAFSLEPEEFASMVAAVREAEATLGGVRYGPRAAEQANVGFRRSLHVVSDVRAGEVLTEASIRAIRPGHGLAPKHLHDVLGRRAARDLTRGSPLAWDMIVGDVADTA